MNEFKSFSNRFRNMDTIRIKDQKEYKRIMKYLDKKGYQYYDIGHGKGEWHIQFDNTRETSRIRRELEKKRFKIIDPNLGEAAERDYKDEYKKFQSSPKSKKYRAELNKYNRKKGTYGNGDGKDASHKGGKISGFEKESVNRGRKEKSRLKKEQKLREAKKPVSFKLGGVTFGKDYQGLKSRNGGIRYYYQKGTGSKNMESDFGKFIVKVGGLVSSSDKNKVAKKLKEQKSSEQKLREAIRKIIREDFAGSYPEHVRKKFDGKRRKQSEVLGYKLTGVNDVKTEIDDATVKEVFKRLGQKLTESGIMYKAGVKKYGKEGMKKIQSAAGKDKGHEEIGKIKDKYEKGKKEGVREAKESAIDVAKRVVQNKQHEKGLDLTTANFIMQVYNAYKKNPSLQKKLEKLPLKKMIGIVYKLIK